MASSNDIKQFPPRGLTWFWFLNGDGNLDELKSQIRQFADGGGKALVLHPRNGLLVPYASDDWWEHIKALVDYTVECGMQPWLYDEDPYPSGHAGGILVMDHPEWRSRQIERFEAPEHLKEGELFVFPAGKLCYVGLVPVDGDPDAEPIDVTSKAGVIRRVWDVAPWDSRWYYPTTPLYPCQRSSAHHVEWSMRVPEIPSGYKLIAYVARDYGDNNPWGAYIDSLNLDATKAFIEHTYEGYKRTLGDRIGSVIPAIFTDEPKAFSATAYTPGMFEDFQEQFGYDLKPRLEHLFSDKQDLKSWQTRIDFRTWAGKRFTENWVKPIGDWCKQNNIALVGHISPEDDVIQQATCIGNLAWQQPHLGLAGIDLIIPAVGDRTHSILNIGALSAVSIAQQHSMPGVMSETLGASGVEMQANKSARILAWQVVSGVSTIVVHGAFESTLGLRLHDAPPDYGPHSPQWEGLLDANTGLIPFADWLIDSRQQADVAMVWPIRTAMAQAVGWEHEDVGDRKLFHRVVQACLEAQVGLHLIDEDDLARVKMADGKITVGRASYQQLLIPPMSVISEAAMNRIGELVKDGLPVQQIAGCELFVHKPDGIVPASDKPWEEIEPADIFDWAKAELPKLADVQADDRGALRMSMWHKDDKTALIVMNIEEASQTVTVDGLAVEMTGNTIVLLEKAGDSWQQTHRFCCDEVAQTKPLPATLELTDWQFKVDDEAWQPIDRPRAMFELVDRWEGAEKIVPLELAGKQLAFGSKPVADHATYRVKVHVDSKPSKAVLRLEPTSQNGHMTITLAGQSWDVSLNDVDYKAIDLDISSLLKEGANEIEFMVHNPVPLDGIRWPPSVLV